MPKEAVDSALAMTGEFDAAVSIGLLLLASLAAGILADLIRIPKVTAYLLAGVLVGPSVVDAIGVDQIHSLEPLTKLAMALVLLELGCAFSFAHIRPILRHAAYLSIGEILATFALVGFSMWLFGFGLSGSVLMGALALATAPATTVLVLKEANSEGPVTELAGVLVALNNIAAIIAFELLFLFARVVSPEYQEDTLGQVQQLFIDLGGAGLMGMLAGLVISFGSGMLSRRRWLVMVIAVSILLLGLCDTFGLPYMLAFLVAGMVVVNTSDASTELLGEQEKIAGLLVVVFFAVHGAELELEAFLAAGAMGLVYIVARCAGKILGVGFAASWHHEAPTVRKYLGACMLAQAGAAIALASVAAERWPELGERLQVIILGSVVFFEIVGPVLIRWSVLRAGEVPLAQAVFHSTETPSSQAAKMWLKARDAVGLSAKKPVDVQKLKVADLLRSNVKGLSQTADFEQVVKHIRRSHDNTYVVLDSEQRVAGLIRYELLSDTFFDSSVDSLVRAEDLATPAKATVNPESSVSDLVDAFRICGDDVLAVVAPDGQNTFLGVVRRSDLTELAIRVRK
ncbi:MAG: cation:proton antiporter [Planctomycetota bacterium]